MNLRNPEETSRGAEVLSRAGYRPGSGTGERGRNRWGDIALGVVIGAVAISPWAFVAGSRSNLHFVSDAEMRANTHSSNEIRMSTSCIGDNSSLREVLITFDQTNYNPADGGVVLVGIENVGSTYYRHLSPILTELTPTSNILNLQLLKRTHGESIALYREKRFINNSNQAEKDSFDPSTEILDRLGYLQISEDVCGNP